MSSYNEKSKSKNKYKSFLCCWCFSKRKPFHDSDVYSNDINEPYEYIVEKLAIKKVPISLFTASENTSKRKSRPENEDYLTTPIEDKPSVSFASYYKIEDENATPRFSQRESNERNAFSFDLSTGTNEKEIMNLLPIVSQRPTLTEKQSQEIVAKVLNKHASLYTLDHKTAVPKDPNHIPINRTVVPPSMKQVFIRSHPPSLPPLVREPFEHDIHEIHTGNHKREVYAEVHQPPYKKEYLVDNYGGHRKKVASSLLTTIDSLKFAQKPHYPGVPPKNQRSLKADITDSSSEREFYTVQSEFQGRNEYNDFKNRVAANPKMFTNKNVKKACDYNVLYNKQYRNTGAEVSGFQFPFATQTEQSTVAACKKIEKKKEKSKGSYEDKYSGSDRLRKSKYHDKQSKNKKKKKRSDSSSCEEMVDSEQVTDVHGTKGQSLKWKIIIKHHQDKKVNSDGDTASESEATNNESVLYSTAPR